ncbi:MAG: glycosyltransferase [Clostridia bacterium]|nr:glycosyltransferase [Clostridia bacterium]
MKVIQMIPTLALGDAVGNDTFALKKVLMDLGYETSIHTHVLDSRLPDSCCEIIIGNQMPEVDEDDVVIYHMSTESRLNFDLETMNCRKIMIYHNITPVEFMKDCSYTIQKHSIAGYAGLKNLVGKIDYCLADSEFNKQDLIKYGYTCPIDVRPILIPLDDYKKKPDSKTIKTYGSDGFTNILFVGRIAPNKKHEDIIAAFAYYNKNVNSKSRLILAGSNSGFENYDAKLKKYAETLGVMDNVIFTGHISFKEILAFYSIASVFLCMSEHEGFCVPLAEAMFFKVPIIAYDACAIPYTLDGSGALIDSKNPVEVALLIDRIVKDEELRNKIIEGQNRRLEDFQYEKVKELFAGYLKDFINKGKA